MIPDHLAAYFQLERHDAYGRLVWIRIASTFLHTSADLFLAICYFPPDTSHYARLGGDPFDILSADIATYSRRGIVLLGGDFNAHTSSHQIVFSEDLLGIHHVDLGYDRVSPDQGFTVTPYGERLLQLVQAHQLVILNGLSSWPLSAAATCHPFRGGSSVVDYFAASPALIPLISDFSIRPPLLSDHSMLFLSFSLPSAPSSLPPPPSRLPFPHLSPAITPAFADHLSRLLRFFPYHAPLDEQASFFTSSLRTALSNSTIPPRITTHRPVYNRWYDRECSSFHKLVLQVKATSLTLFRQRKKEYRALHRRKKKIYLQQRSQSLLATLFSTSSSRFWRTFLDKPFHVAPIALDTWVDYATSLYTTDHLAIVHTLASHPSSLFSCELVEDAIRRLKLHKA